MKKLIRNLTLISLVIIMIASLTTSCFIRKKKDFCILFTNDTHCELDVNIGFPELVAYRNALLEKYNGEVMLVDCGDAIQGELIGTLSAGEYVIDIMNEAHYNYAIPGNHEFDYGIDQLQYLIDKANAFYLACNIDYIGNKTDKLSNIKPYMIDSIGNWRVALIGVCTPESITESNPNNFKEDGEYAYYFYQDDAEKFYKKVQDTVDECKKLGAEKIFVLAHLGVSDQSAPFRSYDLAANTEGIDVIFDGHSHTIMNETKTNKSGKEVKILSTGTKFASMKSLTVHADGSLSVEEMTEYPYRDETMAGFIEEIESQFEELLNEVICTSEEDLLITDANGVRMIRNREMAIGDFVADAYSSIESVDIGFVNGGGIRDNIYKGEVTYEELVAVCPYNNDVTVIKATGQQILDALELSLYATAPEYEKDGKATGEFGGFLQVSNLKFTVNTTIPTPVILNAEDGSLKEIKGQRRVSDVQVLKDGVYSPIDSNAYYNVASTDYILRNGGNGYNMFDGDEVLMANVFTDNQLIIDFVKNKLGGVIPSEYAKVQDRITIIE